MTSAEQPSLFTDPDEVAKPAGRTLEKMRVLITVKAAPVPSETYGETVCVAGIRVDEVHTRWVRLYPINFRELETERQFRKYDIVSLQARPSATDPRPESFRPVLTSVTTERRLTGWAKRRPYVMDLVHKSMCELLADVRELPPSRCASLAAIRPRQVQDLLIRPHPGWSPAEQAKIDRYANQVDLFGQGPRRALQAPRFKGWYRYLCQSPNCRGHEQGIHDWEFVRLQRRLRDLDDVRAKEEIHKRFLHLMCAPDRDVVFYVGNQQKHMQSFMVLGVFYPPR